MRTNDDLLSPQELAAWLRLPVGTIYGWRYRGGGPPAYRVGRHVRYRRSEVDEWLETRRDGDAA